MNFKSLSTLALITLSLGFTGCQNAVPLQARMFRQTSLQTRAIAQSPAQGLTDQEINNLFPSASGHTNMWAYGVNRSYTSCNGCTTADTFKYLPLKVLGAPGQNTSAQLGEDLISAPSQVFWAELCKWFIQNHAESVGSNWQLQSWELIPGVQTMKTKVAAVQVRELRAHVIIGNQPFQAQYWISAQAGLVSFRLVSKHQDANGEFALVSRMYQDTPPVVNPNPSIPDDSLVPVAPPVRNAQRRF